MNNIYKEKGYNSRKDYLENLSKQYNINIEVVLSIANELGPSEDFDGLVNALEDLYYMYDFEDDFFDRCLG